MLLLEFEANGADPELIEQMRQADAEHMIILHVTGQIGDAPDDQ